MENKMNYINLTYIQWAYLINAFLKRTKLAEQFSKYTDIDLYDIKKKYLEFVKENKITEIGSVYFIKDLVTLNIMEDILFIMTKCNNESIESIINGISNYIDNITGENEYTDIISGIINDVFDYDNTDNKSIRKLLSSQNPTVTIGDDNWNIIKEGCYVAYYNTCKRNNYDRSDIIYYYLSYIGANLLFKKYGVKVIRKRIGGANGTKD